MENIEKIKVLWVDDQIKTGGFETGFKIMADRSYGIALDSFSNWEDAEKKLKEEFEDFSAIILDAECIYGATDNRTSSTFIPKVVASLATIFAEKGEFIPWYILSAGTMSNFDYAIEVANDKHAPHKEEWGKMVYLKTDGNSIGEMFSNIKKVTANRTKNKVAYHFRDVFKYLGEGKLISKKARKIMMEMLCAFYYPAENWDFKYEDKGNPLRKVVEYIFRAAYDYGLLPDECYDSDNDRIDMIKSYNYMSGKSIKDSNDVLYRYGPDISYKIFSDPVSHITYSLINFTNTLSHSRNSKKTSPYTYTKDDPNFELMEKDRELFFSYVLQLCHVIKFFGNFVEEHSNKEENRKMKKKIEPSSSANASQQTKGPSIKKDKNKPYLGDLPNNFEMYVGKSVKISNVKENKDPKDNIEYPYFANIKIRK